MNKRVLITGATGFVGSQILKSLLKHDLQVRIVIREGKQNQITPSDKIESILTTQDIFVESVDWWKIACRNIDIVIHCAWYAEPGLYQNSAKNLDCLQGTLNIAKGMSLAGSKRFIGIGTCFEYDLSYGLLSIATPLKPLTSYAGAKVAAFNILSNWFKTESIEFAWCRLFYLYGENEDERRLIPYLKNKLASKQKVNLSFGEHVRDYLDVVEAGRLIQEVSVGEIQGAVNICSGIPVTIRQIAEKIADEYGCRELLNFETYANKLEDPPFIVGVKSVLSNYK